MVIFTLCFTDCYCEIEEATLRLQSKESENDTEFTK